MNQLFETFNINQRVEALEKNIFTHQNVAIVVPMFDESQRFIELDDPELYISQLKDAISLSHQIAATQIEGSVCVLPDGDEANEINRKFDHLILLHEFVSFEAFYVIEGLRENNKNLQVTEIY